MKSLNAMNALYEQEKRNMKNKHKQFQELRKQNGNASLYSKSGTPKEHNAVDYSMYDAGDNEDYDYAGW